MFAAVMIFSVVTEIFIFSTLAFQTTKYKTAIRMIFEPGMRILLVIFAFLIGLNLLGAVYAFGLSLIAGMCVAYLSLSKLFPAFNQTSVKPIYETKDILRFSWPLFFVGFFNIALIQINTLLLGYFREAPEVGIYGAAFRTAFLIPISLESINAIFAPIISELYINKDFKKLKNLFKITTKWIFTISFPLFLFLVYFAEPILRIWGKDYTKGTICLIILCIGQLINSAVGSVGYMITMIGRSKINLANISGILVLNVFLNLILIPRYGIVGAAISVTASLVLINIVRLIEVFVILKTHPYRWDFLKPLIAGGVTISLVYGAKLLDLNFINSLLSLVLGFIMFVVIYSGILLLLGMEEEDKFVLEKVKMSITRKKTP
jgi:O-antigen/teichoic acid export membrane protein